MYKESPRGICEWGDVKCKDCGSAFWVGKYEHKRTQCDNCTVLWSPQKRRHFKINSGPKEVITLDYLLERDKGLCQLCRKPVDLSAARNAPLSPAIDHVIPVSKGGTHTKLNTQLTHRRCNAVKSARIYTLF